MNIGILSARSANYHPNRRLLEAGRRLGHGMTLIHPKNCLCVFGPAGLDVILPSRGIRPAALVPRIGSTINPYAGNLLRHFELAGIPLINSWASVRLASDKCRSLQCLSLHGIPVIESCYASNSVTLQRAVNRLGGYPVVVKTPRGRQGAGVLLVDSAATGQFAARHAAARVHGLVVQRFVPPEGRTDIRVFVLGSRTVAAVELKPKRGEFRSNVHLKAVGRPVVLPPEMSALAVRAARALGLGIAGADIMVDAGGRPLVVEVNHSPGFRGLEALTGIDIASQLVDYVAQSLGGPS
jgi:ribosomal protein S6--L-glutamate ligase